MSRSASRRNSNVSLNSLINYANMDDTYNVKSLLYENHSLNILELQNQKQYTLIHLSCYNNNEALSELYLQYLQAQVEKKMITFEEIKKWINLQNDEGFTAIHLAAYRGSLVYIQLKQTVVQLLEQYGADYTIKNFNGIYINELDLSVMHTSAQGDSPLTIYYFLQKGIDINILDNKGSTPLHWAAYSGSFNAVNFLLSWGSDINLQDLDTGVSALHLATMQGNSRIVRKLLMKGINRDFKDNSGKTALDLAIDSDFKTIATMIRDKIGILEYCNVRQPFRPAEKRQRSLWAFLVMYLTCFILTIIFTLPFVKDVYWLWAFVLLTTSTVFFFLISWLRDPGVVKIDPKINMLKILQKYDCSVICAECKLIRPKRSKHCDICGQCVMVYDHHCPWINNCVGANNHFVFYFFIISLFLELILQAFMQGRHLTTTTVYRWHQQGKEWLIDGKYFTFVYVIIYCICFSVPLGILLYIQTMNLLTGQTTFERHSMGGGKKSPDQINGEDENSIKSQQPKKEQISCQNCFDMCFSNKRNSEYSTELGTDFIEL